jgi:hypothetical protein
MCSANPPEQRSKFIEQPRAGVGPPAFGGGFGDAEHFGGFLDLQSHEVAELDQFGLPRLQRGEAIQGVVEREQLIVGRGAGDFEFVHVEVFGAGAATLAAFAAGAGDKDAAHRLGGGAEEVRAVLPRLVRRVHELQPGFVDERGGLERVAGGFAGHLVRGQAAQFVVNHRQQFVGGLGVFARWR